MALAGPPCRTSVVRVTPWRCSRRGILVTPPGAWQAPTCLRAGAGPGWPVPGRRDRRSRQGCLRGPARGGGGGVRAAETGRAARRRGFQGVDGGGAGEGLRRGGGGRTGLACGGHTVGRDRPDGLARVQHRWHAPGAGRAHLPARLRAHRRFRRTRPGRPRPGHVEGRRGRGLRGGRVRGRQGDQGPAHARGTPEVPGVRFRQAQGVFHAGSHEGTHRARALPRAPSLLRECKRRGLR